MTTVEAQIIADRIVKEVGREGGVYHSANDSIWATLPLEDLRALIVRVLEKSA